MTTKARILADSVNPYGDRLTTFLLTFPRFLLAEFNSHRAISRNAASSRAVSVAEMLRRVEQDPFVPSVWYANGAGMTVDGAIQAALCGIAEEVWRRSLDETITCALSLNGLGVHKSYINRLLEPYAHVEVIASATEWENFFALRCASDAQPEFRDLALLMLDAYRAGTPTALEWGRTHLPFDPGAEDALRVVRAVAQIARVSYANHEKAYSAAADQALYDRLLRNGHMSPFEHIAVASHHDDGRWGNFRGWAQFRHIVGRDRVWDDVTAIVPEKAT